MSSKAAVSANPEVETAEAIEGSGSGGQAKNAGQSAGLEPGALATPGYEAALEANLEANLGANLGATPEANLGANSGANLGAGQLPIVAIDGPAGAGKSTVAARLAAHFGLLNLETGAMYRAFALKALRGGIDPDDAGALETLSGQTSIALVQAPEGNRVLLDGVDVSSELRSNEVTQAASRVSVHGAIRGWMVGLQQALGARGGVVMEGRDIGTAVFPRADVKIFLDASPEARSQRRYQQGNGAGGEAGGEVQGEAHSSAPNVSSGAAGASGKAGAGAQGETHSSAPNASSGAAGVSGASSGDGLSAMTEEMLERDQRDRNRAHSPLRPAEDAVVIDSTHLTLDEVVEQVTAILTARWAQAPRR